MDELMKLCNKSLEDHVVERIMIDSWNEGDYLTTLERALEAHDFKMSKRDKTLIRFLVQWLGSSLGLCFVRRVLSKLGLQVRKLETEEMLTHHNASIRVYGRELYDLQKQFPYSIDAEIEDCFLAYREY